MHLNTQGREQKPRKHSSKNEELKYPNSGRWQQKEREIQKKTNNVACRSITIPLNGHVLSLNCVHIQTECAETDRSIKAPRRAWLWGRAPSPSPLRRFGASLLAFQEFVPTAHCEESRNRLLLKFVLQRGQSIIQLAHVQLGFGPAQLKDLLNFKQLQLLAPHFRSVKTRLRVGQALALQVLATAVTAA